MEQRVLVEQEWPRALRLKKTNNYAKKRTGKTKKNRGRPDL